MKSEKKQTAATIPPALLLMFFLNSCTFSLATKTASSSGPTQSPAPIHIIHPTTPSTTPAPAHTATLPAGNPPDGTAVLRTWDLSNEKPGIDSVFITKYGRHLATLFEDGRLMVYNFKTDKSLVFESPVNFAFLDLADGISSNSAGIIIVEYSPNESGNATLWQISDEGEGKPAVNIKEPKYYITALAISPDGETMALGYNNGEIRLIRTGDGALTHTIQAHKDSIAALAFSWDNIHLLSDSWSFDPFTHVFRVSDGSKAATLISESYEPGRISFSPDSQLAAVTSADGTHIFSTGDWMNRAFIIPTFDGKFTCNSQEFMVIRENQVDFYSVTTGKIIRAIEAADTPPIFCLYNGQSVSINVDYQNSIIALSVVEP